MWLRIASSSRTARVSCCRKASRLSTTNFSGTASIDTNAYGLRHPRRLPQPVLQRRSAESIAAVDVARSEAGLEPARALRRRAVRKRVRYGVAARLFLQRVVADRR